MTDRPIIFSAPMVKALLGGRKSMTRRLAWRKPVLLTEDGAEECAADGWKVSGPDDTDTCMGWPPTVWQKARPGDRLYVRETWKPHSIYAHLRPRDVPHTNVFYKADDSYAPSNTHWRRSIHMPRWASRLTLVVTATKVERLNDISRNDVGLEGLRLGLTGKGMPSPCDFRDLWDSLHGPDAWADNPEVCAISFNVVKQNIDQMGAAT